MGSRLAGRSSRMLGSGWITHLIGVCAFFIAIVLPHGLQAQVSPAITPYLARLTDSSYTSHVLELQAFGTRYAKAANVQAVTAWLDGRFRSFGFTDVAYDSFTSGTSNQRNVIATLPGTRPSAGEIIVCSHYDSYASPTTAAPGADDNASGTAAVLEMARVLKTSGYTPRSTLRFITFGAGELGLVGSNHYAALAKAAGRTITQVQNYDMIAYCPEGAPRAIRVIWYANARDLAERDSSVIRRYTTLTPVPSTQYWNQSDSYGFSVQGYRAFFNIEQTFTPWYHTAHDSATFLNMAYGAEVSRSGLALLLETDASFTSIGPPGEPAEFVLEQNYPNPFNGETMIRYSLPRDSEVRIVVSDLLGRELAVIAEGPQTAGLHQQVWDASRQASGVYLCRMTSGGFTGALKLLLLR
jgi:hypothetical protein